MSRPYPDTLADTVSPDLTVSLDPRYPLHHCSFLFLLAHLSHLRSRRLATRIRSSSKLRPPNTGFDGRIGALSEHKRLLIPETETRARLLIVRPMCNPVAIRIEARAIPGPVGGAVN